MKPAFSIYMHIPYCSQKCPYCDFNTYATALIPEDSYINSLVKELEIQSKNPFWSGRTVRTIFFGGGTPSLFHTGSYEKILRAVSQFFPMDDYAEISIEANPENITATKAKELRASGINRLSLGVQSFNGDILKRLGRRHTGEDAGRSVIRGKEAGFQNISLDLMFGVPDQSVEAFADDISHAISIEIPHVSIYSLTIEEGTPFYRDVRRKKMILPDEETVIEMIDYAVEALSKAGLARYEISNFASSGHEALHNLAYWNQEDYLGLGAGAHSYCGFSDSNSCFGTRWANFAVPSKYSQSIENHKSAESWKETLSRDAARGEFFMLGLRKINGVRLSSYAEKFGTELGSDYQGVLEMLLESEFITIQDDFLHLTKKGFRLADSVIESFFPDLSIKKTVHEH